MAIAPGVRLGPYEIVTAVGAGGMGEVYRARDTRLDRTVARRRFIAFTQAGIGGADVWVLPLTGERTPFAVAHTPFIEDGGAFSPDGHWLAFSSNESGQFQVTQQLAPSTTPLTVVVDWLAAIQK